MAKLKVNNQIVDQFYDFGTPPDATMQLVHEQFGESATYVVELTELEEIALSKAAKRADITTQVADTDSLLGTTSDTTHLLLNELSGFINKLNKATTLAEVRASATSLQSAIGHIEADVAAGSLTFPYQSKGQQSVMDEISARATAVNQVLSK
ncbi:hypothetical protein [Pseudoalteromonas aurantia]|uniref:Uncharacterized protein n=1 Tax=Pseudoalteromonas aurantia 208 TaxID=1314867 RepID=A0ABR9EBK3_9GAMM|nr:hypothetical protein [Pseudoalteromonas aurantia]MBE0367625.1 hypothetical protein [Pseudoalteromonas aurantia 208]